MSKQLSAARQGSPRSGKSRWVFVFLGLVNAPQVSPSIAPTVPAARAVWCLTPGSLPQVFLAADRGTGVFPRWGWRSERRRGAGEADTFWKIPYRNVRVGLFICCSRKIYRGHVNQIPFSCRLDIVAPWMWLGTDAERCQKERISR